MWYYASNGQQQGPFDDGALDRLVATGTITNETLVWKEGMVDWSPLRQVHATARPITVADAKSSTCMMCGKQVGADNLIDLLGVRVCAACKPMAVQTLKEGGTPVAQNVAWRQGKKVVTHAGNALPRRCFKCNHEADGLPLTRKLQWHHPIYFLLLVAGLIFYVLIAMITRKRATVDVFYCARHNKLRKNFIAGAWSGVGLSALMIIGGMATNHSSVTVIGFLVFAVALIGGLIGASVTRASPIKGNTVWLTSAGKEFLASLPEWTG